MGWVCGSTLTLWRQGVPQCCMWSGEPIMLKRAEDKTVSINGRIALAVTQRVAAQKD